MREIKFRGKRVDNGEWVYGQYASRKDGREHYIIQDLAHIDSWEWNADAEYVIPETVGQFTGLTDKNGREIYEGDYLDLKYFYEHDYRPSHYYQKIEVRYFDFNMSFMGVGMADHPCHIHGYEIEVIGNIHDK